MIELSILRKRKRHITVVEITLLFNVFINVVSENVTFDPHLSQTHHELLTIHVSVFTSYRICYKITMWLIYGKNAA